MTQTKPKKSTRNKRKNKNPLYVVKGQNVEEASGLLDMLVKKFNLQPLVKMFNFIIEWAMNYLKGMVLVEFVNSLTENFISLLENLSEKFGGVGAGASGRG